MYPLVAPECRFTRLIQSMDTRPPSHAHFDVLIRLAPYLGRRLALAARFCVRATFSIDAAPAYFVGAISCGSAIRSPRNAAMTAPRKYAFGSTPHNFALSSSE